MSVYVYTFFFFNQALCSLLFKPIFFTEILTHTFTLLLISQNRFPNISQPHKIFHFDFVAIAKRPPLVQYATKREGLKSFKCIRKNYKNMWNEAVCRGK